MIFTYSRYIVKFSPKHLNDLNQVLCVEYTVGLHFYSVHLCCCGRQGGDVGTFPCCGLIFAIREQCAKTTKLQPTRKEGIRVFFVGQRPNLWIYPCIVSLYVSQLLRPPPPPTPLPRKGTFRPRGVLVCPKGCISARMRELFQLVSGEWCE